ncbi:MAG TPA: helix-turn-helix domain-containing protein [Cyclobacteriaceae bacterium]|jgi:transcriptional regulator GlxA family with amidase domain
MKHISILVPEGALLGNVEGPRQLFSCVNDFLASQSRDPIFSVELVGLNSDTSLNYGKYTVRPDRLISEVDRTDLVIVPAVDGDLKRAVELNSGYIPWIVQQYKNGAEVASLCVGAFILAATGLLNGRKCATHWMFADQFRSMYPDVKLVVEKIITDENGLYSSGGAFSYLNLILYLIEKYASRDLAIACSKVFQIDIDRNSQSPFIIFKGQKDHEDETVLKAQEFIEKNFQEKITVDQLASMLALGRRNLERRFKKATSNTVVEYIQRVKIEAAKMRLETSRENVNEVMYQVGYTDTKAFRTTFKKITGMSPLQYKVKYSHRAS